VGCQPISRSYAKTGTSIVITSRIWRSFDAHMHSNSSLQGHGICPHLNHRTFPGAEGLRAALEDLKSMIPECTHPRRMLSAIWLVRLRKSHFLEVNVCAPDVNSNVHTAIGSGARVLAQRPAHQEPLRCLFSKYPQVRRSTGATLDIGALSTELWSGWKRR
jgi:hypothetical protein